MTGTFGRPLARAAVVAVGSELLGTTRLDTNSLFITDLLSRVGVDVVWKAVVGDDRASCAHVLRHALAHADLVVVCGGLGPTDDDVTRDVVADVLGRPLAEDPAITERLLARYAARGYPGSMPENNRRQALVPQGAAVIANAHGSAPGLWMEDADGVVLLLLPGPPRELKPMCVSVVDSLVRPRASGAPMARAVLKITGRIESEVDQTLHPLYVRWSTQPTPVNATILAALGQIELHLSARDVVPAHAQRAVELAADEVRGVLGPDVFSGNGQRLEEVLGSRLVELGATIATAESCTGGLMASRLTDVMGSSRYVLEAVVAYTNEAKVARLGVSPRTLEAHGAVSEPVARQMAEGVRRLAGSTVGVGITGIAGPHGGTPEKPVGTVAVAVATPDATESRVFRFYGEREHVKFQASQAGLDMVRRILSTLGPIA